MSDSDASAVSAEIYSDIIWLLETYTSVSSSCLHNCSVYAIADTDAFSRGPRDLEGIWVMSLIQTLPMEVEVVWNDKITLPNMLFLLNRYGLSLGQIINMAPSSPGTETDVECNVSNILATILTIGPLLCTNLLFTLRVYATSSHSKSVLFVCLALILARLVVDSWQATLSVRASTAREPVIRLAACVDYITVANTSLVGWSYVASGGLALTFDGFIFTVTVVKLFGHLIEMRKTTSRGGISELLLRDGTIYFVIMFLVASTQGALALASALNPDSSAILSTIMDPYFQTVPNLLVNHLYLNLRRVNRPQPNPMDIPAQPPRNRFLGNIGEPLDHDQWDSQFDCEDFTIEHSVDVDEDTTRDDAAMTLVPVIYDNRGATSNADIEMMPIERDSPGAGPSQDRTSGSTAQL